MLRYIKQVWNNRCKTGGNGGNVAIFMSASIKRPDMESGRNGLDSYSAVIGSITATVAAAITVTVTDVVKSFGYL